MERLIAGAPGSLLRPDVNLILSACSVDTGRMHHFVTEREVPAAFRERVDRALGEVVPLETVDDVLDAAVASSAVPLVFEPAHFNGHEYLDGGVFSNQPLHAALADGADSLVIVLVSPSGGPPRMSEEPNVLEILSRLPQIANWRDLQSELRQLPAGWSREGDPARVCVVEPSEVLPATLLGVDASGAERLIRLGAEDAWTALERAGWLEPQSDPG
jgi:predicted patatin/cPLA2 family phospholipase